MLPDEEEYMAIELHNYRNHWARTSYTELAPRDQDALKAEARHFIDALDNYRKPQGSLSEGPVESQAR